VWRFLQRIPGTDHGYARARLGHADPAARAWHRVRGHFLARASDGVRRNAAQTVAALARPAAGIRSLAAGADARLVHPTGTRRVVPACCRVDRLTYMRTHFSDLVFNPLPGALPVWHVQVSQAQLVALCRRVCETGGRLVTMWGEDARRDGAGFRLCLLLQSAHELIAAELSLHEQAPICADLSKIFPSAERLQRALHDMLGITVLGG